MGPVRLFTPYKRKRRKENEDGILRKVKKDHGNGDMCDGVNGDESCDSNGSELVFHLLFLPLSFNGYKFYKVTLSQN